MLVVDLYSIMYIVQLTKTLIFSIFLYSTLLHNKVKYLKPNIDYKRFSFKNIE